MYNIDVRTEVRKIASSKPVHAAAGAGVLATQTLRELPGRIVRGIDDTVTSLPGTVTSLPGTVASLPGTVRSLPGTVRTLPGTVLSLPSTVLSLPGRATGAVLTARDKAADGYDMLAAKGKKALDGPVKATTHTASASTSSTSTASGGTSAKSTSAKSTSGKSTSTRTAPAKTALNSKGK
jgi:hypothetical protein